MTIRLTIYWSPRRHTAHRSRIADDGRRSLTIQSTIPPSIARPRALGLRYGNTSNEQNPVYTYSYAGTFTVSLNATNSGGSNTVTRTEYISVSDPAAPTASFTASGRVGIAPLAIRFTDTSKNYPTSWLWDFGDGNTSTEQNPTHT